MKDVAAMLPPNDVNMTGPMALPDPKSVWLRDAALAILALAVRNRRTGATFTADDVREHVGKPEHPNWTGTAFATAHREGVIEAVGVSAARVSSRNGGSLKVWRAAR